MKRRRIVRARPLTRTVERAAVAMDESGMVSQGGSRRETLSYGDCF